MAYLLKDSEPKLEGNGNYIDSTGNHECAIFVQQAAGLPNTKLWRKGAKVFGNTSIARGTAIATFGPDGNYNGNSLGKHAAIYLSQNSHGVEVYDQWNKQGKVKKRRLRKGNPVYVNNPDNFYIIES